MYLCACLRPSLRKSDDMGSTTADALGFLAMPPVIARSKASLQLGASTRDLRVCKTPSFAPGQTVLRKAALRFVRRRWTAKASDERGTPTKLAMDEKGRRTKGATVDVVLARPLRQT